MKVGDAVSRAETNENVRKLKGYFLGSCFASLNEGQEEVTEWTMLYYNSKKNTVVDCFVSEKFVTVGEETPAIKEITGIDTDEVRIDAEDAVTRAKDVLKNRALNVLISLHNKEIENRERLVWTVGLVTPDFSVTSYDIDAVTGKILREETTRLIRRA